MATSLVKSYIYQIYSYSGVFLGTLNNVKSEFAYNQNINSAGAQLEITLQSSFDDVGASQSSTYWIDNSGNKTIDEVGNRIVFSLDYTFANIPIDLGNRVKVFASYDGNKAGKQVFDGQISKWHTEYGNQTITLTVLSWGFQLDNFLLTANPTSQTIDQEVYEKSYIVGIGSKGDGATPVSQGFNIASATTVGSIIVFASGSSDFYTGGSTPEHIYPVSILIWSLYSGTPTTPGELVDAGQVTYTGSAVQQIKIQLSQPKSLNGNYFIQIDNGSGGTWYYGSVTVYATATNPYAGGSVYTGVTSAGTTTWTSVPTDDLAFIVQGASGSSTLTFSNQDPGTLLRTIITQAIAQGSVISYSTSSIDLVGTNVSYTYKVQTILEGIQKILQLSPSGWYWYVDPGTNYVHFHRVSNTVTHLFIIGNHIKSLSLEYSLEQIVNSVYFSGGATGGVNLYTAQTSPASISRYGQRLERLSDNRITDSNTAQVIMSNELGEKNAPLFYTTVEILETSYDIETINVGDTVGLRGSGNLIDSLTLQIMGITRTPDRVTLSLGSLLPRSSSEFDAVKRRLDKLETVANPAAPS